MSGRKSILVKQVEVRSGFCKGVVHPNALHWYRKIFHQYFGDGTTKAAEDDIVLRCDNRTSLLGRLEHHLDIQRFEWMVIDDTRIDALC